MKIKFSWLRDGKFAKVIVILSLFFVFIIPSYGATKTLNVYYYSPDGFIPITRRINAPYSSPYTASVMMALDTPELEGLFPIGIPKDTILSVEFKEGTVYLNFSRQLLNESNNTGDPWFFIINPLIANLLEFPEVDEVQILFEGKKESYFGESEIGEPINRKDYPGPNPFAIFTESEKDPLVNIYYPKFQKTGFLLVPISTGISNPKISFKKLLEVLLTDWGSMKSPFPQDTRILEVKVNADTVLVNFSKEIFELAGINSDEAIAEALRYTASELDEIKKIQVLVDNKTVTHLGPGNVDFSKPLEVPDNPIGLLPLPKGINSVSR